MKVCEISTGYQYADLFFQKSGAGGGSIISLLPFGGEEADTAALIRANLEQKGMPIGPLDTLIAATAITHQFTLITHNTAEFSRVSGLLLQDWY